MPYRLFLRSAFFLCGWLMLPVIGMAQTVFEGQVISKDTEITIPGVTVKLIKENRATSTNGRGYYKLISQQSVPADSLLFTSIGYKPLLIAVAAYQDNMVITMEVSSTQLKDVTITNKVARRPVVHKFALADIKEIRYIGKESNRTWPYTAKYMVAMQIKAKHKNVRIASVNIGRREFDENYYPKGRLALPSPYTRFLVHVMSCDEKTNLPDKKLYTREVSLNDNAQMITVDVSDATWTVKDDTFFVVVEWLRKPINEILQLDEGEVVRKVTASGDQKLGSAPLYRVLYQPALAVFEDGRKFLAYCMNQPGVWEKVQLPGGVRPTTLAMSATIFDQEK